MSFTVKFESFWTLFSAGSPFDLPAELRDLALNALKTAGFETPIIMHSAPAPAQSSAAVATAVAPATTGRLNAWNLYLKEQMPILGAKDPSLSSSERMALIGPMWKALSDEEKKPYQERLALTTPTKSKSKSKKAPGAPQKLTGYQLFVKETMPAVTSDPSVVKGEHMKAIGARWRAAGAEGKAKFNERAKQMSFPETAAEPAADDEPTVDEPADDEATTA